LRPTFIAVFAGVAFDLAFMLNFTAQIGVTLLFPIFPQKPLRVVIFHRCTKAASQPNIHALQPTSSAQSASMLINMATNFPPQQDGNDFFGVCNVKSSPVPLFL
jgi:hypothetical protein